MPRTTPLPHFYVRSYPVLPLLEANGEYVILDTAKTVVVDDETDLEFGTVAAATEAVITFAYESSENEDFGLVVGLCYTGDNSAFTYTAGDSTGDFTTPVPLVDGGIYWMVVLPDTTAPLELTITALAANDGVEKTGTLTVADRFVFGEGATPTRTLKEISLSKTYVAP